MLRKFLPVIFSFFMAYRLDAQICDQPGGMRHVTVKEGLPGSEVYTVIQDRKGYLWMGTDAGVCRYNGYFFETYTTHEGLSDNTIFRLQESADGKIWAQGLSGALNYFDGTKFRGIPANDTLRTIYANGQRLQYCMEALPGGMVIIGGLYTDNCYFVYPDDNYTHAYVVQPPDNDHSSRVVWTADNRAYAFAFNGMAIDRTVGHVYHNGHFISLHLEEGTHSATNNRLLLTHDNRLLYSFGSNLWVIEASGKAQSWDFGSSIVGLNEDREGNIWVCLFYGGTVVCPGGDFNGARRNFLHGKTVSAVLEDNESGYWFSTVGDGVYYLPDINFHYLTHNEGLPETNVMSLVALENGSVAFGMTNSVVCIFDPLTESVKISDVNTKSPLAVEALFTWGDTILVSENGFRYLDSNLKSVRYSGDIGHAKICAVNPVTGDPFFLSHSHFYWFKNKQLDHVELTGTRFTAATFTHDGVLWLGSLAGLWKYQNGKPVSMLDSFPLVNSRVDGILEDSLGVLWVITRGEGLYAIDGRKTWHFTEADGLAGNSCRTITTDESGRTWIGTNRGITLLTGFDRENGRVTMRSFNRTSGLLSDDVKTLICSRNRLWIGSNEGLCWIDLDAIHREPVRPPVYITRILFGDSLIDTTGKVQFSFTDIPIRIFIEGLNFHEPEGLLYRYRLLGGSGDWITTANREISFTGLGPGEYTVEIEAINGDGGSSKVPARFTFEILAPFWRTWWFISLLSSVILLLGWLLAAYRARILRKKAKEKADSDRRIAELRLSALRAQMNPHFIFNAINSIQHFVLKNDGDKAYHYLSRFSNLIRLVLEQSQSDVIPLHQEIKMLELYVELEQLRFERPFRYEVDIDPELLEENVRVPGMLVQPFVENAIWHGLLPKKEGDAVVRVEFKRTENELIIIIEDNGIGRAAAARNNQNNKGRTPHGLRITEERLRLAEQVRDGKPVIAITDLQDEDGNASGTRVEIKLRTVGGRN
jgi:ligand-binding sensor domain-containing protein